MIAWMVYAVLVTLALSAAALLAERAAKVRGVVTRWLWVASLIGSLVLPTVIACATIRLPDSLKSSNKPTSIVLRDATSIPMPSVLLDLQDVQPYAMSADIDALARTTWVIASALMVLVLVLGSVLLQRRKHGWHEGGLCGERVLVAPDAGPAVVGLMRPRIVVPAWLLHAGEKQQQCTLAHERSHLEARDPQVIALGLALLTLMPWNLLLWWQFRRLRRAIEVDCDARVLLSGHDIATYCETLIQVGQRQSGHIAVVPAMSDSASFLELRIRQMLHKPGKWARTSAAALVCVSLGMAAFAAQVTPPDSGRRNAQATVVLGNDTLDRYTGFYQISPISLIAVTRAGNGLTVSISGQIAAPKPFHIVPISETRFAVEGRDGASVHFVIDANGYASRLVATQNGRVVLDQPRIDKVTADQIDKSLADRIKAQKPFPGSGKALRLLLSDPDSGAGMSPALAWARNKQKASREKYLAEIGPVESYTFKGVSKFGSDTYLVKRKHGEETIMLVVDKKGTLVTAVRFSSMAPARKT